jgi:hypothetical protein
MIASLQHGGFGSGLCRTASLKQTDSRYYMTRFGDAVTDRMGIEPEVHR